MKKLAAFMLVLCLLPIAAIAETSDPTTYPWYGDMSNMPISEETIELDVWATGTNDVEDMFTNEMTLFYEELTNVHVNWTYIVGDEATQKNLSLASGDYPDIYFAGMSTSEILTYADAGVFIPLEDLIAEHAPNIQKMFDTYPELAEMLTAPDGHIYSLARGGTADHEEPPLKMWVFLPWMEQYMEATGAEEPKTLDELCDMLRYFRDNDMNGNGDATDEIPMFGNMQMPEQGSDPLYYLMNAFTYFPANLEYGDGEKAYFAAQGEKYREGLQYIRGMVEEGLISETVWTTDLNTMRSVVNVTSPEEMIVGTCAAPYVMRFVTEAIYPRACEDFFVLEPIIGPDGYQVTPDGERAVWPNTVITSACEDPVAAIKWLDGLQARYIQIWNHWGDEGTDWEWTGEYDEVNGPEIRLYSTSLMEEGASTQNRRWTWWLNNIYVPGKWQTNTLEPTGQLTQTEVNNAAYAVYEPYIQYTNIPNIVWNADEDFILEMNEMHNLIWDYAKNMYTQFVLGTLDINDDTVWADYESQLYETYQLDKYLEMRATYWYGEA